MSTLIQETGAEVTRAALPRVHIPKVHLVQVFQNLIGNAIKYRKPTEKPMIHVDARPQDGSWIFSVRDNGIGISPQFHSQIFRIFGRLHGTEMPGTGIGLALCKKLVERAGGTIWVESQPDAGSIFYFTVRA
jgi:light-regulated signal transduction histidine kinase (bacteriophytochrome)